VTEDLGRGQARAADAVPRQRGGAHAAAKSSRFRRKNASVASDSASPAVPAPPAYLTPPVSIAPPGSSAVPVRTAPLAPVSAPLAPRPRTAREPPPTWSRDPITAPLPAIDPTRPALSTTPAPTAGSTGSVGLATRVAVAVRSAAVDLYALAIVAPWSRSPSRRFRTPSPGRCRPAWPPEDRTR
jgi:hypothetical protein